MGSAASVPRQATASAKMPFDGASTPTETSESTSTTTTSDNRRTSRIREALAQTRGRVTGTSSAEQGARRADQDRTGIPLGSEPGTNAAGTGGGAGRRRRLGGSGSISGRILGSGRLFSSGRLRGGSGRLGGLRGSGGLMGLRARRRERRFQRERERRLTGRASIDDGSIRHVGIDNSRDWTESVSHDTTPFDNARGMSAESASKTVRSGKAKRRNGKGSRNKAAGRASSDLVGARSTVDTMTSVHRSEATTRKGRGRPRENNDKQVSKTPVKSSGAKALLGAISEPATVKEIPVVNNSQDVGSSTSLDDTSSRFAVPEDGGTDLGTRALGEFDTREMFYSPFVGQKLLVTRHQVDDWVDSNLDSDPLAVRIRDEIAKQPTGVWFGAWIPDIRTVARGLTEMTWRQNALFQVVIFNLPFRDGGSVEGSEGVGKVQQYKKFIDEVVDGLKGGRGMVVLEPDALVSIDTLDSATRKSRYELLKYAVRKLAWNGLLVYIDIGNPRRLAPTVAAERLLKAGIEIARGCVINTASSITTGECVEWGNDIISALEDKVVVQDKGFLIDIGRNGAGPPDSSAGNKSWMNSPLLRLGEKPTTSPPKIYGKYAHAFLWIKNPVESDGRCLNGGPNAGIFWPRAAKFLLGEKTEDLEDKPPISAGKIPRPGSASSSSESPVPAPKQATPSKSKIHQCRPYRGRKVLRLPQPIDGWIEANREFEPEVVKILEERLSGRPAATWLDDATPDVRSAAREIAEKAVELNCLYTMVLVNIPYRDSFNYSNGGAKNESAYKQWIDDVAEGLGSVRGQAEGIIVLEPDAVPLTDCLTPRTKVSRFELLQYAVLTLSATGAKVYIDVGNPAWLDPRVAADRLQEAGVADAAGFALNVTSSQTTEDCLEYGRAIGLIIGASPPTSFIIDTSRNGAGPPSNGNTTGEEVWCNNPSCRIGMDPTLDPPESFGCEVDAIFWIKVPGISDGFCAGGPAPGDFCVELAKRLAGYYDEPVTLGEQSSSAAFPGGGQRKPAGLAATAQSSTSPSPYRGLKLLRMPQPLDTWIANNYFRRSEVTCLKQKVAGRAAAFWIESEAEDVYQTCKVIAQESRRTDSLYQVVLYGIPFRDAGNFGVGGCSSEEKYRKWVDAVADGLRGAKGFLILEPDALALMDCLKPWQRTARFRMLQYATKTLSAAGAKVYIDAGHARWLSAKVAAERLGQAGIGDAAGFSLNVGGSIETKETAEYGMKISKMTGRNKGFVIDTSRNGNGPPKDAIGAAAFINPPSLRLGYDPDTSPSPYFGTNCHAFLWLKVCGVSDGFCNGGPAAGIFWVEGALRLAGYYD